MALETPARGRQVRAAFFSGLGRRFNFFPCASQSQRIDGYHRADRSAMPLHWRRYSTGQGDGSSPWRCDALLATHRGSKTMALLASMTAHPPASQISGFSRCLIGGNISAAQSSSFVSSLGCFGHELEVPSGTRDGIWTTGFSRVLAPGDMDADVNSHESDLGLERLLDAVETPPLSLSFPPARGELDIRCRPAPVTHRTQFARRCGAGECRLLPMCLSGCCTSMHPGSVSIGRRICRWSFGAAAALGCSPLVAPSPPPSDPTPLPPSASRQCEPQLPGQAGVAWLWFWSSPNPRGPPRAVLGWGARVDDVSSSRFLVEGTREQEFSKHAGRTGREEYGWPHPLIVDCRQTNHSHHGRTHARWLQAW